MIEGWLVCSLDRGNAAMGHWAEASSVDGAGNGVGLGGVGRTNLRLQFGNACPELGIRGLQFTDRLLKLADDLSGYALIALCLWQHDPTMTHPPNLDSDLLSHN